MLKLAVALATVALIATGCYAQPTHVDQIDQSSATVHSDLQCTAYAPAGSTYRIQLRREQGMGDWENFGHPAHPFTCPQDENPNADGYQCTNQSACAVTRVAENFMGLACGGSFYTVRALESYPNGQTVTSNEIRFQMPNCG